MNLQRYRPKKPRRHLCSIARVKPSTPYTIISVEHNIEMALANSINIYHIANGQGHLCSPSNTLVKSCSTGRNPMDHESCCLFYRCNNRSSGSGSGSGSGRWYHSWGGVTPCLSYDFIQNAFFVAICISLLCPCIGIFMVLRRFQYDWRYHGVTHHSGYYTRFINEILIQFGGLYLPCHRGFTHRGSCENIFHTISILFLLSSLSLSIGIQLLHILSSGQTKD